jgi:multiple sugar transport system substrate-binding protein
LFVPLDQHFPHLLARNCDSLYAGPSLASYRYSGTVTGAPIDAAVQHAIYRRDLVEELDEPVPSSWQEALALGRRVAPRAKAVGGAFTPPHAFLTFASLCANLGKALPDDPREQDGFDRAVAFEALVAVKELAALAPPAALEWDSIALHDAMSRSNDVVYCPCEFGYATYGEADMPNRLAFAGFAGLKAPFSRGAILGGVGLGVPACSPHLAEALSFIEHVLSVKTQQHSFATHHGQPAFATVWEDGPTDERFNGFFSSVRATMDHAAIRPRFPGFIQAQFHAGRLVHDCLRDRISVADTVDNLSRLFEGEAHRLRSQRAG